MNTLFIGQNKITLQTVDSTNNYATNLLKMTFVPDGTVIMAQNQTEGKGRRQNSWVSEPNANLLCSFVFSPKQFLAHQSFEISMLTALASLETIVHFCPKEQVHIKWPNDIMLNNRKVGGILIENSMSSQRIKHIIIGIGLNVNQREFDFPHATSMCNEVNSIFDADTVLEVLCEHMEKWCLLQRRGEIDFMLQTFNSKLWKLDTELTAKINSEPISGKISGVERGGKILFNTGTQELSLGLDEINIPYA